MAVEAGAGSIEGEWQSANHESEGERKPRGASKKRADRTVKNRHNYYYSYSVIDPKSTTDLRFSAWEEPIRDFGMRLHSPGYQTKNVTECGLLVLALAQELMAVGNAQHCL